MELALKKLPVVLKNGALLCCWYKIFRSGSGRIMIRLYTTTGYDSSEYLKCYNILNVKANSDQETVRQAFLKLVKQYHPDSGSSDANAQTFQEIERAYRKLQEKFHAERWMDRKNDGAGEYGLYYKERKATDDNVVQLDIKHTAPQHRQYLSYDGIGVGTPAQRHKQFQKHRASNAVENVYNHRISKMQQAETINDEQALVIKDKQKAKNIKTRFGMDRLVEDLIQESMARGEFDNLSGKGKPLSTKQDHHNPYVDLVTHKLNQVMIDNGFMPEWISLQKEIREDVQRLREKLEKARDNMRSPTTDCESHWEQIIEVFRPDVQVLNSKIGKYNLVVPLLPNQMLLFDLEKEAKRIFNEALVKESEQPNIKNERVEIKHESIIQSLLSIFGK